MFRDILQVSRERIKSLDDADLNSLVSELLRAHTYRCNGTAAEVRTNAELKAGDGGCDGWTPAPKVKDHWFGDTPTCWQLKAGTAGQPHALAGEITKPIPRQTLQDGHRFALIASASTSGTRGERDRLKVLQEEAIAAGLPADRIEVFGTDRLTNWCNEYPAVAAAWAGQPSGLMKFGPWSNMDVHQAPWQSTPALDASLEALRNQLDLESGSLVHVHIQGPPGVGKSRFALELCRGAAWNPSVIYFGNGSDFRLPTIIRSAVSEPGVRLMVVADEISVEQLSYLRDSLEGGNGRVRLITIGHSESQDPTRIPNHPVRPLEPAQMSAIILAWHPSMPREHVDFVVQFSDGFIKLARLAADAVAANASVNVRQLLASHGIPAFMDQMLGTQNRQHLYVVAALTSIGWTGDVQQEGESVARHFGWNWNDVRATAESFLRQFGIVPRGGRYRYISPKPLAIYLAVEAWDTYPDVLRSLPEALPTEASKGAYEDRLQTIASNPQAKQFSVDLELDGDYAFRCHQA
jgi:hypothetical protein